MATEDAYPLGVFCECKAAYRVDRKTKKKKKNIIVIKIGMVMERNYYELKSELMNCTSFLALLVSRSKV